MTGVAAVMVNWNQAELTERSAAAIAPQVETLIIVDNASNQSDRERLSAFAQSRRCRFVTTSENLGYAGGCNAGIRHAIELGASEILVMNNDAFLESGSIAVLCNALVEGVGAVAPAVYEHDRPNVALHVGCSFDERTGQTCWLQRGATREQIGRVPRTTDYVSGELFLAPISTFLECGVFAEHLISYYEDVEWSLRVRARGLSLMVVPGAVATHMVGASGETQRGSYLRARNRVLVLGSMPDAGPLRAIVGAALPTLSAFASLARRGMLRAALEGPLRGWASAASELIRHAYCAR